MRKRASLLLALALCAGLAVPAAAAVLCSRRGPLSLERREIRTISGDRLRRFFAETTKMSLRRKTCLIKAGAPDEACYNISTYFHGNGVGT